VAGAIQRSHGALDSERRRVSTKSALLVGGGEDRLTRIVTELEGLGYETLYAPDAGQALEALRIVRFSVLLCFDPALLARIRKASGAAAEQCWFVAVYASDSSSDPQVRFSQGGTDIEGADAVLDGDLASGGWADVLGQFSGVKPPVPGEAARHAPLAAFDRGLFELQMSHDSEAMAEIIHLYERETPQQLAELGRAITDEESQRIRKLAHTLKGTFGAVCASRAGLLAQEIELAAADSSFSRASALFRELGLAVSDAQAGMEKMLRS
jgi:HPt (histidine-containing phosphotransfer) domain-containing protein